MIKYKSLVDTNLLLSSQNLRLLPTKIEGKKSVSVSPIVGEKCVSTYSSEGKKSSETSEKSVPIEGENVLLFEGKNPWDTLRIARQFVGTILNKNTSLFQESVIVVCLYNSARTFFLNPGLAKRADKEVIFPN